LPYHEVVLSDLSSTGLRRMLRLGLSIRYQVPESVRRCIEAQRLYGWPGEAKR
jgi:nicotinic acid mononucleotide adenylyltransferase